MRPRPRRPPASASRPSALQSSSASIDPLAVSSPEARPVGVTAAPPIASTRRAASTSRHDAASRARPLSDTRPPLAAIWPPASAARDSRISTPSPLTRSPLETSPRSSRCHDTPADESCRSACTSLSGPFTAPSTCSPPRGGSAACPHHFAAFSSTASALTRTVTDGSRLMSATTPSMPARSSGVAIRSLDRRRSRPSNDTSPSNASIRVLVAPTLTSAGESRTSRPLADSSTVSAGTRSVTSAGSSR